MRRPAICSFDTGYVQMGWFYLPFTGISITQRLSVTRSYRWENVSWNEICSIIHYLTYLMTLMTRTICGLIYINLIVCLFVFESKYMINEDGHRLHRTSFCNGYELMAKINWHIRVRSCHGDITKARDAELIVFSLFCALINGWVNNGKAGNLRHHRAHYDVTVLILGKIHRI